MKNLFCLLIVSGLIMFFTSCQSAEERNRRTEVEKFLGSLYENSSEYKTYFDGDENTVPLIRQRMSRDFAIVGGDSYGAGGYDYKIKFRNGATGIVFVYVKSGKKKIDLLVSEKH